MRTIASWRALLRLLGGSGHVVAASAGISVLQALLLIPIAFLVREVFNESIPDGDTGAVIRIGLLTLLLLVASAGLTLLTRWLSLRATKAAIARLRTRLMEKVTLLPRSWFDSRDLGSVHSLIVQDSERLDVTVNAVVSTLLPAAIVGGALSAVLVVLDPLLAAVVVGAIGLMVVATRPLGGYVRGRTRVWHGAFDRFSSHALLSLRASTLTKLRGAEATELVQRRREAEELSDAGRAMGWGQTAHGGINNLIAAVVGAIVLIIGGVAVAEGRMSLGDLISFYAVLGLLRAQLQIAAVTVPLAVSGMESLNRLSDFLEEDAGEPYSGSRRIDFGGAVALRGVSFGYEPGRAVLSDVDLSVAPGETVLLLGQNGAGKSTIISLIAGLYEPGDGIVEADGIPLSELEMASLRAQMGVVPQDPLMLPGSVRENIAFGRPDATDADVDDAARRAGAADLVAALPQGLETPLGDEGLRLSGGQRQRIALARALLGDPKLLMLDEPSTHLDREGTQSLLLSLRESGGPAVLLVSHEVELTEAADRVLELRGGTVSETAAAGGAAL